MNRRIEVQVGAMVLVAIAILIFGVTWLKDLSIARRHRLWMVSFEQTGGLSVSDEVQVNGIRKGDVQSVDLLGDGVLIHLALDSDVTLTRNSQVAIRDVGLMGEKVIAVTLRQSGPAYTERDTIVGIYEKGIPEVVAALGPAVGAVADLTTKLEGVADALNKNGDFAGSMQNLRVASVELRKAVEENRRALQVTVGNMQSASQTAKALTTDREAALKATLDHFASAAEKLDRLSSRLDSLRASIQTVSTKVERGQGTLGKLVNDDRMYDETRTTIAELKALIADIKANPKKYLTVRVF